MKYEIRIFAKDRTKIIRFAEEESFNYNTMTTWEDFYYAMGAVIDGKADKFKENDTLVASIDVKEMAFDQVVDTMCEDLTPALTKILTEEKELSILEMA